MKSLAEIVADNDAAAAAEILRADEAPPREVRVQLDVGTDCDDTDVFLGRGEDDPDAVWLTQGPDRIYLPDRDVAQRLAKALLVFTEQA